MIKAVRGGTGGSTVWLPLGRVFKGLTIPHRGSELPCHKYGVEHKLTLTAFWNRGPL